MTATVVLVHGAWHGAWCWERVTSGLRARGVPAVALDLPGHGRDPGPLGDLHTDAARVTEALSEIDGPVVLVGHSYGGAVITEAGDHPSVVRLVYLCAMALKEGESCVAAAVDEPADAAISHAGRPDLGAAMQTSEDDVATLDLSQAAAVLYNDCDPTTAGWALERLGPQPTVALRQTPWRVAWLVKPSTYVVCANDMTVHPDLQRLMASRCSEQIEWNSDHSPFLSKPELVVDLLVDLASRPTSNRAPSAFPRFRAGPRRGSGPATMR